MSFERTRGGIQTLTGQQIGVDQLMGMLVDVVMDAYEENNISEVSAMPIHNQENLYIQMYNLIDLLLSAYLKNEAFIQQFDDSDFHNAAKKLLEATQELAVVKEKVDAREQKRKELEEENRKLEETRGHLLTLEDACSKLQEQINKLQDKKLDTLPQQKEALEAQKAQLEQEVTQLEADNQRLQETLVAAQARHADLTRANEEKQAALNELAEKEKQANPEQDRPEEKQTEISENPQLVIPPAAKEPSENNNSKPLQKFMRALKEWAENG